MGYTLRQFNAYLELAAAREREQARWSLIAPAIARAGGDPLKKALKRLEG
jgi:hypothetical protein